MTDEPFTGPPTLQRGLAYGLMLDDDATEGDILAEVLRIARAGNEHFDLLVRVADTWTSLDANTRINIRTYSEDLYDVLGAISTFVSVHRTSPAPPERNP